MIDGLAITIKLGDAEVPGWLPLLPQRFALEAAYRAALGYVDGDAGIPSNEANEGDFGAVLCACVALCWGGDPLELIHHTENGPSLVRLPPGPAGLRKFGRDVVAFGDAAADAFVRRGYQLEAIFDAGRDCRRAMLDSIPTESEVEEAAGFTGASVGDSTAPTSK
jgi:hypothetical protein